MENLLLQSDSKEDIKMFQRLARKAGLKARVISKDTLEDAGLVLAMKKGRTGRYVNTENYLKKLKGK